MLGRFPGNRVSALFVCEVGERSSPEAEPQTPGHVAGPEGNRDPGVHRTDAALRGRGETPSLRLRERPILAVTTAVKLTVLQSTSTAIDVKVEEIKLTGSALI